MNKLENMKVREVRYTGDGNVVDDFRFKVTTDDGRVLEINTDNTPLLKKYGFVMLVMQAENGDYVASDNKPLVATLAKAVDAAERDDVQLGRNQVVTLLTEAQADEYFKAEEIPEKAYQYRATVDFDGKEVA